MAPSKALQSEQKKDWHLVVELGSWLESLLVGKMAMEWVRLLD